MEKGSVSPVFAGPTCSVRFSKFFVAATGTAVWLAASVWGHAEQRALSISSFDSPFGSHKLIYAYPAVTVENGNSSVWGENFSAAPNLRSMPTAVSVQSSVWSSSFAPAPEPRTAPAPRREPESAAPAEPKPKKHKHIEPAPAEETEKPRPKKHVEAEEEPAQPKFHARPRLREKEEEAKDVQKEIVQKEVVPPVEEKPLVQVSGSAGYYSRYMFRGLDVAYRTGIDKNNESAFVGTNAAIAIGDFALGAWYIQSLNSYVPGGAGFDKSFGDPAKDTSYRTPPRERYQEYDLFANYTFHLTHDLALTTGMNFYWFSDGRFWAQGDKHVDSTMEAAASLSWTGVPYLNQSLSYYYDFDAFKGAYLEYKVATKPLQIYRNGDFAIGLSPSLSVSYDFRYNGTNNGWNNFEPGIDMPIHISDGLGLNVGVRYSWDFGDHSSGAHGKPEVRTDDRLWFSASFQYNFPVGSRHESTSKEASLTDSKSLISAYESEPDNGRWRVSAGAGMRTMHASFDVGRAAPYNIGSLFSKKTGGGDLGFASDTNEARYLDGVVHSGNSSLFQDGTTDFTVQNASQIRDDGAHGDAANNANAINRQVTYHSERYNYSTSDRRSGFNAQDDDQVVYPYLNLSYEILKTDRFTASVGVGYQYNHSSTQSGTKLVGLQTATENHAAHQFIYNVDEIFSTHDQIATPLDSRALLNSPTSTSLYWLVVNAGEYNANYGSSSLFGSIFGAPDVSGLGPQHTLVNTQQVLATVATFRASQLDADMHSISIPFDLSYKLTDRIQARLSCGPTFNLFNNDLVTETDYQLLSSGAGKVTSNQSAFNVYSTPTDSNAILPPGPVRPGFKGFNKASIQSNSASVSKSGNSSEAGGKGSVGGVSRNLPGKNLRKDFNRYSGQHFEAGVFGQLTLEVDLDAAKRWFVEMYARYDYVPTFTISDGATSTTIDASSWGAGIGIGFHF